MTKPKFALFDSLSVFFSRLCSGRIHFSQQFAEKVIAMGDDKHFQVIRHLKVDLKPGEEKSVAVFIVRFKFSGLPIKVNTRLSMIPTPFLLAKRGFREKIWSVANDGTFQGIYQWVSYDNARSYPQSFIFNLMVRRAAKGTLTHEIIADTLLSDYIKNLIIS
jgi:hypothetical protein